MNNKGTQALIKSDFAVLTSILKNPKISVSTTDIEGVKSLGLPFAAVSPSLIDIPHEIADDYAKRNIVVRNSLKYKVMAASCLIKMPIQILLVAFSTLMMKIGLKGVYRNNVLSNIKDADVVISCSDENFKETASLFSLNFSWILVWWSMLLSRTWDVLAAKFLCKKIILFPNSVGPFITPVGKIFSRLALNSFSYILVRESISFAIVDSFKILNKYKTSDAALLFPSVKGFSSSFSPISPSVGVCLGLYSNVLGEKEISKYISLCSRVLDAAVKKYGFSIVFLPHYVSGFRNDDKEISQLIAEKMIEKDRIKLVSASSVDEFKLLLSQMDMVISSKMHPAVLSTSAYVPTLVIAYDQKQTGYFEDLELSDCVLSIQDMSQANFFSKISHVWDNRVKIARTLKTRVPILMKNVKEAIENALCAVLEGGN